MFASPTITTRTFEVTDTQRLEEILLLNWGAKAGRSHYDAFFVTLADDPLASGRTLVAEIAGQVVGFGMIGQHEWHASAAMLGINVAPSFRRRGVGGALYEALLETWTRLHGPRPVRAVASERQPDAARFLEQRGFSEDNRTLQPMLEFVNVDEAAFQRVLERLEQRGISVRSLTNLGSDPDYELRAAALLGSVYGAAHVVNAVQDIALEDWLWELREYKADGVMIAIQNGAYIGFGGFHENPLLPNPEGFLYGTLASHAVIELEISLGIIAAQVRYLRARGFENLHLQIDSDDLNGMALIKALPITPQPAFVTYLRPLELTRTG